MNNNNKSSSFISSKNEERNSKVNNQIHIISINSIPNNNIKKKLSNDLDNQSKRISVRSNIKQNQKYKDSNNDFYHVNTDNITLFVYNFST